MRVLSVPETSKACDITHFLSHKKRNEKENGRRKTMDKSCSYFSTTNSSVAIHHSMLPFF